MPTIDAKSLTFAPRMKPTIISNLHLYWFGSVSKNNQTFLNAPLLLLAAVCLATSLGSRPAAAQSVYSRSNLPHQRLAAAPTQPSSPSLNPTLEPSKSPSESLNSNLNAQWMFEILLGEMYNLQGSTAKGYSLLLDVAKKSGDEKLFERAVELALQARSF